jgi:glycosyltransferase involved in cell wall biosynthesis
MLRILIISAVFPPEPVVSAILSRDLAEELSKKNGVTVICPTPTRPEGFKFDKSSYSEEYEIFQQNSFTSPSSKIIGRFWESYSFGKSCVKYIKANRNNIKCIYVNSWPLFSQYLIIKIAKKYQIPNIIHVQDIYPESLLNKIPFGRFFLNQILMPIDKYTLRNSSIIIAISEKMKQTLAATRGISENKITVVPNWQDEELFIELKKTKANILENPNSVFTFMYLGNNGTLAGVEFIIKSFFYANIENSKLIIAGSGSKTNECIKLTNSLNAKNIEFVNVPEGMVPSIQDKADVMLLPVKKNGAMSSIPSKLPAYMFSSKPIIASLDKDSDTAKAINDSGCGIVIEPENEKELIYALKQVASWTNQTLVEKGNSGFEYAMRNFSRSKNIDKMLSVFNRLLLN